MIDEDDGLGKVETVVYRYVVGRDAFVVPKSVWDRGGLKREFREWCRDNLRPGYDIITPVYPIANAPHVVTVIDETDADMLALRWGRP